MIHAGTSTQQEGQADPGGALGTWLLGLFMPLLGGLVVYIAFSWSYEPKSASDTHRLGKSDSTSACANDASTNGSPPIRRMGETAARRSQSASDARATVPASSEVLDGETHESTTDGWPESTQPPDLGTPIASAELRAEADLHSVQKTELDGSVQKAGADSMSDAALEDEKRLLSIYRKNKVEWFDQYLEMSLGQEETLARLLTPVDELTLSYKKQMGDALNFAAGQAIEAELDHAYENFRPFLSAKQLQLFELLIVKSPNSVQALPPLPTHPLEEKVSQIETDH